MLHQILVVIPIDRVVEQLLVFRVLDHELFAPFGRRQGLASHRVLQIVQERLCHLPIVFGEGS
ncbi:hypothetical protein CffCFBP3418_06165 [Curtobacterium flaccumfaciens pv. flaccumfaciens]|nr:hypothetical protein CffCFBP3418_06165 [Curtobacterium flaccumfaciens pv. flaccumfaciens]